MKSKTLRRRLVSAWISTIFTLSMVLLLVGVGTLLIVNAREVGRYFKENLQVSVLLKDNVSDADAQAFQKRLDAMPGVRSTRFISKEEGVEEMSKLLGSDFLEVFETAPVPVSIDVNLEAEYVSADSLAVVKEKIAKSPLVDEVVYQTSLVDALNENLAKISLVLSAMVAVLLFISFVLIANTVRLDLFNRRFSIYTMHLVGATRSYIRAPFVGRAALQGILSALLGILLLVGVLFLVKGEFAQLFVIFTLDSLLLTMGVMLLVGVFVCTLSTYIVVGRLVGYNRDQLYAF